MLLVGSESLTFTFHAQGTQLFRTHKEPGCLREASISVNCFHFAANFCHEVDFGPLEFRL